jgi:hypothetical protein
MDMRLTWAELAKVLPAFPGLVELALCRNFMVDWKNLTPDSMPYLSKLEVLNLDHIELSDISHLSRF